MNKSQLHTLSGVLLASTALAGAATAGTVGRVTAELGGTLAGAGQVLSTTSVNIANTLFTSSASPSFSPGGQNAGTSLAVSFSNSLPAGSSFNATVNVTGASMNNPNAEAAVLLRVNGTNTFVATVNNACGSVTPLVDKILISNCVVSNIASAAFQAALNTAAFMSGLKLSGIVFNSAAGLASAGATVSIDGTINDAANTSIVIENITSGTILTATDPISESITAGTSGVANAATTPTAFTNFTSGGGNSDLTLTLATVVISASGAVGTDLGTLVTADPAAAATAGSSSVTITVTSAALSDDAAASVTFGALTTLTPAAFSAGTAAISSTGAYAGTNTIQLHFNGTLAIDAAAAGTVAIAYGSGSSQAASAATAPADGATAAISSGGFQTRFNGVLATGASTFTSYLRIANTGSQAGAVTISLWNSDTGASMGSWTMPTAVPAGGSVQVSASQIEAGAGITADAAVAPKYDVSINGPIVGYGQHVMYNAATDAFSDLSAFRNGGSDNGVP